MDWTEISKALDQPLDPKHVHPPRQYGPKGHYIEAWLAQAEANRIFGHGGWHQEVVETTCVAQGERAIGRDKKPGWGVTYTAKVRVNVDGVTREDFGAGHGYDLDLGLAHESAIKEAVSDAMKRAMKSFGWPFGLALYDKTREHVGNGETPPAKKEPEPAPAETNPDHEAAVVSTRSRIHHTNDLDKLAELWGNLSYAVQADARVIQAKDERKRQLQTQAADPQREVNAP